jgi:hypothetical protein
MWSLGVVAHDPRIELALRGVNGRKHSCGQELVTESPMKALNLAGRRGRERRREEVVDPVVATEPVEEHFGGGESESIGEDLAVEFLSDVKSQFGLS